MNQTIVLLGIGNILWADEGFGVRVIEHLQNHYRFPDRVRVIDGGTQGFNLIEHVQAGDVLVIFDAVDFGLPPATLHCLENQAVPQFLGAKKMSLHQTGFQEVLAAAELLGQSPSHLCLIGVQPEELEDYGGSLRSAVKAQIQPAIELAFAYLERFSVQAEPVDQPCHAVTDPALDMERYERERPSEEQACRSGDSRVMQAAGARLSPPRALPNAKVVAVDYRGKY